MAELVKKLKLPKPDGFLYFVEDDYIHKKMQFATMIRVEFAGFFCRNAIDALPDLKPQACLKNFFKNFFLMSSKSIFVVGKVRQ